MKKGEDTEGGAIRPLALGLALQPPFLPAPPSPRRDPLPLSLPGTMLSLGFGFVEYWRPEQAQKALRQLQVKWGGSQLRPMESLGRWWVWVGVPSL